MFAKVGSSAINGIEAFPVEVEVNSGFGDSKIVIVGLPDVAVRESQDRVLTALNNSAFKFPLGRTTINLAPADVRKEGPSFDLPIAVGILAASEQITNPDLEDYVLVGELALTGAVPTANAKIAIAPAIRQCCSGLAPRHRTSMHEGCADSRRQCCDSVIRIPDRFRLAPVDAQRRRRPVSPRGNGSGISKLLPGSWIRADKTAFLRRLWLRRAGQGGS
jgi:hypothetical protein